MKFLSALVRRLFGGKSAAPRYLKLSRRTWAGLRKIWGLPASSFFRKQYLLGTMRSLVAEIQFRLLPRTVRIAEDPVVILGFWRSGTTLLHELMAADDRYCFPSTYDCLNPHHFVLSSIFSKLRSRQIVRRPQDGMTMGWTTPQEDEFALLALGARSPYEGLVVPEAFEQAFALCDPQELPAPERKRWETIFMRFLRGLSWINGGRPIVLKSPAHGYRIPTIKTLLPTAKFVLIVRNPYETLESMLNTYKAFAGRFGLGARLADDTVRALVLRERVRFEAKMTAALVNHPPDRIVIITYESLVADPVGTLQGLYRRLGLPDFEYLRPRLTDELARRSGYARRPSLPDNHWQARLETEWAHLFKRYGYRMAQGPIRPARPQDPQAAKSPEREVGHAGNTANTGADPSAAAMQL